MAIDSSFFSYWWPTHTNTHREKMASFQSKRRTVRPFKVRTTSYKDKKRKLTICFSLTNNRKLQERKRRATKFYGEEQRSNGSISRPPRKINTQSIKCGQNARMTNCRKILNEKRRLLTYLARETSAKRRKRRTAALECSCSSLGVRVSCSSFSSYRWPDALSSNCIQNVGGDLHCPNLFVWFLPAMIIFKGPLGTSRLRLLLPLLSWSAICINRTEPKMLATHSRKGVS